MSLPVREGAQSATDRRSDSDGPQGRRRKDEGQCPSQILPPQPLLELALGNPKAIRLCAVGLKLPEGRVTELSLNIFNNILRH